MSYCTEKYFWKDLDKDESDEKALIDFCKRIAVGNLCKMTVAQLYYTADLYSSAEDACLGVLLRPASNLTKKEKKALKVVYSVARARYDKRMNEELLSDNRFHQNAKIIITLRELASGGAGVLEVPAYNVKAVIRKEDPKPQKGDNGGG